LVEEREGFLVIPCEAEDEEVILRQLFRHELGADNDSTHGEGTILYP